MDLRPKKRPKTTVPEPAFVDDSSIEVLKGTDLCRDVPDEAIDHIRKSSRICSLKAYQSLYTTRQGVGYLYVITKGFVSIWIPPRFDPRLQEVFLAWRGPQQIIGELRQLGDDPSNTQIMTYEACEFIEIRLDAFRDLANTVCLLYQNVANLVLKKMWHEGRRSEVVQMSPALKQVAQTLIHLAEDRCENFSFAQLEFKIPGTIHQNELAGYAGLTRERVNQKMNYLRDTGKISYEGKKGSQITILNLHELQEIISPEILLTRLEELGLEPKRSVEID